MLETGLTNTIVKTTEPTHTARALCSGLLDVLSTPMLIAFMEEASMQIPLPFLDEGCSTVGISMNMQHLAATPVGGRVTVTSTLTDIDRKKLTFTIEAHDERGLIGKAVHERFIVNSEAFMKKVEAR